MTGAQLWQYKALCWSIVRNDGTLVLGTTLDVDLVVTAAGYAGTYKSQSGITPSNVQSKTDLSPDNLEARSVLLTTAVQALDIEAGLYDGAAVTVFEVDPTATGTVTLLRTGSIGEITREYELQYTAEIRGLTQKLAQNVVETMSKMCRATLGDSRCTVNLTPLTFNGTVSAVVSQDEWSDTGLNQTNPIVSLVDTTGSTIPSGTPFTITPLVPSGGSWQADQGVKFPDGTALTVVGSNPAQGQYSVAAGVYTFNSADAGKTVFINYQYGYGYFTVGKVKWLTGANTGYTVEVRQFTPVNGPTPADIKIFQPMVKAIAIGDTYQITAGCNRLFGTCRDRFNNVVNNRSEPYLPGTDAFARVLG